MITLSLLVILTLGPTRLFAAQPFGVNGDWDWVDLMKGANRWWNPSGTLTQDTNGWPTCDANDVVLDDRHNMPWDGPDPDAVNPDDAGVYHLSFTGQATISGVTEDIPVLVQNQVYNQATNTTTADVVVPFCHWLVVMSFTNTKRQPTDSPGTGLTNVKMIRPGYPANTPQVFTTGTLNAYGPGFSAIRMLGEDASNSYPNWINTSLINLAWADRVQVTDAYQGGTPAENQPGHAGLGDAWEYMIMLANQTHHDMWINVPVSATDDYVTQLATLLKNGNSYTRGLDPGLHIYLEYSNEVWNWGFPQATYNSVVAQQEGISYDQRYLERTVQLSNLFKAVYGAAAINTTIRPVFLWQYTTETAMQGTLAWGEAHFGAPLKNFLYGIGEAPYYGPSDTSSVDSIFNTMWTGSDNTKVDFIGWQAVATYYGLKEVGYESGASLGTGAGGTATRDPRMVASEVHHFLDNWFAVGGDQVNFFALRGSVSPWGDWMLVDDYNKLNTPKMIGAIQITEAPQPAITAGSVLPWATGQSATVDPSQHVPAPWNPEQQPGSGVYLSSGSLVDYLLRAPASGTYSLTLYGHADSSTSQVQVLVDDALQGTVSLPLNADGNGAAVSIPLTPGFHTLVLQAVGSGNSILPGGSLMTFTLSSGGGKAVVPSAPTNLLVTPGNNQVSLTWAQTSTAASYNVKCSLASGGPYTTVGSPATNSFTDTNAANGKTYYYVVTAVNAAGESAVSPQRAAMPIPPSVPAAPALPGAVATNTGVTLTWAPVANATSYNIKRSTTSGSGYTTLVGQMGTSYIDGGLTNGTTYYYVITAVNGNGESAPSPEAPATPAAVVPGAPTNLTAVASNGQVSLKWTPPAGMLPQFWPPQYTIERSTTQGGPYTAVCATSVANALDTTAANGTTYYYVVTAANSVGSGPISGEASATPSASGVVSINCGGAAAGTFATDTGFSPMSVAGSTAAVIDTSLVANPPAQSVYQTWRSGFSWGIYQPVSGPLSGPGTGATRQAALSSRRKGGADLVYTLSNLKPNGVYNVRLHFMEPSSHVTSAGQRVFNVTINGGRVLTNFDIFHMTGAIDKAFAETIPVTADGSGKIVVAFLAVSPMEPLCCAVEVF